MFYGEGGETPDSHNLLAKLNGPTDVRLLIGHAL